MSTRYKVAFELLSDICANVDALDKIPGLDDLEKVLVKTLGDASVALGLRLRDRVQGIRMVNTSCDLIAIVEKLQAEKAKGMVQ